MKRSEVPEATWVDDSVIAEARAYTPLAQHLHAWFQEHGSAQLHTRFAASKSKRRAERRESDVCSKGPSKHRRLGTAIPGASALLTSSKRASMQVQLTDHTRDSSRRIHREQTFTTIDQPVGGVFCSIRIGQLFETIEPESLTLYTYSPSAWTEHTFQTYCKFRVRPAHALVDIRSPQMHSQHKIALQAHMLRPAVGTRRYDQCT